MSRLPDEKRRKAFFYAEQDAFCYDDVLELTQPFYWQFHDVILDLFRYHFDSWAPGRNTSVQCSVLDVGCGTGVEGLRLLDAFPALHLIGLDFCQPMLDQFERKLAARYGTEWRRRCTLSLRDILDEELDTEGLRALLPANASGIQAIVTAFALHHYGPEEKLRAYRLFFDLLPPGGLFVYGDLFSYESTTLADYAQEHEERWILQNFSDSDEGLKSRLREIGKEAGELRSLWIDHLRTYNVPLAIECGWSQNQTGGEPVSGSSELHLLRSAGFREIGCPYRYFQAGVLWARK